MSNLHKIACHKIRNSVRSKFENRARKVGTGFVKRYDKDVARSVNGESFGCEVNSAEDGKESLHAVGTDFQSTRLKVAGHGI